MKDHSSLHLKVQEFADCFLETDPLREMSTLESEEDRDEAALKWVALTALHGINQNAKKISISRSQDGDVRVTAEYRKSDLPSPGADLGQKIIDAVREITHLSGKKGRTPFALGIRESSIELEIASESKKNRDKISIHFPKHAYS